MTPQEKWNRMKAPQSLEDYHLSLNQDELASFPEGAAFLEEARRFRLDPLALLNLQKQTRRLP